MTSLYISLGHNSSCVLAKGMSIIVGFEQERLDRVKSSSAYPRLAIDRCEMYAGEPIEAAYVGHWFDDFGLKDSKYLDMEHLRSVTKNIVGLSPEFTHHDSHAQSAMSFYRSVSGREFEDADIVVLDGFGNRQECLSVYEVSGLPGTRPKLKHRTYGYRRSLGLMYQYTTSYLGLKMHQDEYKLLGYESHVLEYMTHGKAAEVKARIAEQARDHVEIMLFAEAKPAPQYGDLIDREELENAKTMWFERAAKWRKMFDHRLSEDGVRACIAFCAQTFLEECVVELIDRLCPVPMGKPAPALILTGGCFYNVKLNRRIMVDTQRRIFPHPLAGDQGAAMGHYPGLYSKDLSWGDRAILGRNGQLPVGVEMVGRDRWAMRAVELIESDRIVNVVRDGMEFGPRALCNTTTFALPTRENVRRINALNERDEFMPMAPVLTASAANSMFVNFDYARTTYANRFMITTCAFAVKPPAQLMGVAHKDPVDEFYTARPQVVNDFSDLGRMLQQFPHETLINTSFNYHGEPIVWSEDDACKTHEMQCFRAESLSMTKPITLLVRS